MPSFEESLKKLESIVEQLEKGDLPLEESLKLFEEGVGLSAVCKKELDEAEGKVQMLVKQRDGTLKNKRLFCRMGSDGMTIDSEGNVYLTGKGVTVYDKAGKRLEQIKVPEAWTANVCFGDDGSTLYIAANHDICRVKTMTKGKGF